MTNKYAYYLGKLAAMEEVGVDDYPSDAEEKPEKEKKPEAAPQAAPPEAPPEAAAGPEGMSPEEQQILLQALQILQEQGALPGMEEGMDPGMEQGMDPGMEQGMDPAAMGGAPGLSSEDFAQFAQQDGAEQEADPNAEEMPEEADQKGPNWSGKASLEGGDAATRMMQLGVPGTTGA